MKQFNKEQLLIIKLSNALSRMIDAAEEASATQDAGEYAETVDFLNQNRRVLDEAMNKIPSLNIGQVFPKSARCPVKKQGACNHQGARHKVRYECHHLKGGK